jgi:NADH dehydrogenase
VIVGGGFGGLVAAKSLSKLDADVTVVDENNYHLFQPLLYQVATGGLSPGDITSPIRSVLRRRRNVSVIKARATSLDAESRTLFTNEGGVSYDVIVIATGMTHSYFGRNDWEKLAPGLKTIPDALRIRARVLEGFEKAELEEDALRRESLLTFVIVGAGPTGVELAGAVGELAHRTLKHDFRRFDPAKAKIVLLDFAERILPTFDPRLSAKAQKSLEKLGVTVRTGAKVVQVEEDKVMIESGGRTEEIHADNVFWAAGVEATEVAREFAKALNAETDYVGKIRVKEDLSVPGHPEVFVIGDLAAFPTPLPGVAQVAMQMGKHLPKVIRARERGRVAPAFRYRDYGTLAVIGRNAAVADFGWLKMSGFVAWLIWAIVHIVQIIGFDNRLVIAAQWAYSYLTYNRGARLIVDEAGER